MVTIIIIVCTAALHDLPSQPVLSMYYIAYSLLHGLPECT